MCEHLIEKFNPDQNAWEKVDSKVQYYSKKDNPYLQGSQSYSRSFASSM